MRVGGGAGRACEGYRVRVGVRVRVRVGGAGGAHVVVVHVLLDLVELPSVLLARGVSLREHSGEHGDEGTVKARA